MYKNKDQECGVEDRSFISKSVKCIRQYSALIWNEILILRNPDKEGEGA